eukprot:3363654-Prymnesium_polylepis.1
MSKRRVLLAGSCRSAAARPSNRCNALVLARAGRRPRPHLLPLLLRVRHHPGLREAALPRRHGRQLDPVRLRLLHRRLPVRGAADHCAGRTHLDRRRRVLLRLPPGRGTRLPGHRLR